MNSSNGLKLLGAALLVGAAIAGLVLLPTEKLGELLDWVRQQGVWGPLLLGVVYVVACVLFLPGWILTVGAGLLFGVVLGTIVVSIASVLGATLAFLLGRYLARSWIEQRATAHPKFHAIDRAVGRHGFKIVLLVRLSPVFPFNLLNYAFGLTQVSLRDYVAASWIGMLPGTIIYAYLGSAAGSLAELASGNVEGGLAQQVLFAVGLLATIVVTVLVTRIARRELDRAIAMPDAAIPDATESSRGDIHA